MVGLFGVEETPALIGWRPYLDGKFERDVIRGDCVEGWIERFIRDEDGRYVLDGDSIRHERVYGRVDLLPPKLKDRYSDPNCG